jgi:hypothetical protein
VEPAGAGHVTKAGVASSRYGQFTHWRIRVLFQAGRPDLTKLLTAIHA